MLFLGSFFLQILVLSEVPLQKEIHKIPTRMRNIFLLTLFAIYSLYNTTFATTNPVDYVNPYMGNISHLLKPTYPTIHLPNGMLRVYPQRGDHTENTIHGLPVIVVNHRENCCFNLSVCQGEETHLAPVIRTDYDNEQIRPYYYKADIDNQQIKAEFTPTYRAAIYRLNYTQDKPGYLILNSGNGEMEIEGNIIKGYQNTWGNTRVYIYLETDLMPSKSGILKNNKLNTTQTKTSGDNSCVVFCFDGQRQVNAKYGISFISVEQAKKNLQMKYLILTSIK